MVWQSSEKLNDRGYSCLNERCAFLVGYSDGYNSQERWLSNQRSNYPKAYLAGYQAGGADKPCTHDWQRAYDDNGAIKKCASCGHVERD